MKTTRRRILVTSDPGRTSFPIDMLRYDACWPESESDVAAIKNPVRHRGDDNCTRVVLVSDSPNAPERARWASFGWHVVTVIPERIR